jgi:hypothetical protein
MLRRLLPCLVLFASILRADACGPGVIEYYPLATSGAGACHPGADDFNLCCGTTFHDCSGCGPACYVPFSLYGGSSGYNQDNNLVSTGLGGKLTYGSPFTIGLDFYTVQDPQNGAFAGVGLVEIRNSDASEVDEVQSTMQIGVNASGYVYWFFFNDFNNNELTSDIPLELGKCYRIDFVSDGINCSLYIDGQLAAGPQEFVSNLSDQPIQTFPLVSPSGTTVSLLTSFDGSDGESGGFTINNFSYSVGAVPMQAPATPVPCDLFTATPTMAQTETLTPTETETPSPSATVTATQTPGCSSCKGAGPITREPQGSPGPWHLDSVPFGQPVVTLDPASGKQNTIGWIGCGITCISMIDSPNDPGQIDSTLTDDGDFDESGNLDMKHAAQDLNYSYTYVPGSQTSQIEDALCGKGDFPGSNYVIAEVSHNGHQHFVVVTGEALNPGNECDLTIADPSKLNYTFLSLYDGGAVSFRVFTK